MRLRFRVALVMMLALFLAAGLLLASNMGFVVWRTLDAATPGVSLSGTNTLGLPYQRDADLTAASRLLPDIGIAYVVSIQRFIEPTDGLTVFTGRKGSGPDFPLTAGECYFVRMNTTTNYLIGGSSDPAVALPLEAAGPTSRSGTNFVAFPYHTSAATASQLMSDIGFANVANVQRFVASTDSLQIYTGRKGSSSDFPIVPTECYFIRMNTTVNYVPGHY